jgi:Uma2 family endonuclease
VAIIETSAHRLSTDEYDRMVDSGALEGLRVELLGGLLVDMSPQGEDHALAIHQLMLLFAARLDVLRVQMPLAVADGWVPEPDVAIASYGAPGDPRPMTALFVAEVSVSSQALDVAKALVYARAAIPTYWIVDLPAGVVRVHAGPGRDGYASVADKRGDDVLDPGVEGVAPTTVAALLKP